MKIWFDTEFYENGETIKLISIGAIREDGLTYYAETSDAESYATATPWLMQNVFPHLCGPRINKRQIGKDLIAFVGEKPEFWAYYADYDWVALCQIHGTMMDLPKGWPMYCRDVKQLCDEIGDPELPKQDAAEHHALSDAIWTKRAWEFLMRHDIADKLTAGLSPRPGVHVL